MKKKSEKLLSQIIEFAKAKDEEDKAKAIGGYRGEKSIGESWLVFHLNSLDELIKRGE